MSKYLVYILVTKSSVQETKLNVVIKCLTTRAKLMKKCMVRIGLAKFVNFLWIETWILEYWDFGKIDLRNYTGVKWLLFEEI